MRSSIYEGSIRHRRLSPVRNTFEYKLFLLYLDLDELPHLFEKRWLWSHEKANLASFRREDYLGDPAEDLSESVRNRVEEETGVRPLGPVRLLTHIRYFGYVFNPVTFYYCFDEDEELQAVVAEITNTPWKERHSYVLSGPFDDGSGLPPEHVFDKRFHVSPFMDMDQVYGWRFGIPGEKLNVQMDNWHDGERLFDATLKLKRTPITGRQLSRVLVRYPLITLAVQLAIYWQALKLRLKKCPFYDHPKWTEGAEAQFSRTPLE